MQAKVCWGMHADRVNPIQKGKLLPNVQRCVAWLHYYQGSLEEIGSLALHGYYIITIIHFISCYIISLNPTIQIHSCANVDDSLCTCTQCARARLCTCVPGLVML